MKTSPKIKDCDFCQGGLIKQGPMKCEMANNTYIYVFFNEVVFDGWGMPVSWICSDAAVIEKKRKKEKKG